MLLYLISILFGLFVLAALSDWFSRESKLIRKIPGPKAWPIVGNLLNFMVPVDELILLVRNLRRDYGHFNQVHAMNVRMVNMSNPEDIEVILSSPQHTTKADIYKFSTTWLGDGLPLSNGTKWHQRRRMLTKTFHYNVFKKYMVIFKEETEELLKQVEKETANEQTDLMLLMRPLTLRIIYETVMGISLRLDEVAYAKYLNSVLTLCECILQRFCKIWLHNDFLYSLSGVGKRQKSIMENFYGFTNKVIEDRRVLLNGTNFNAIDHDSISNDDSKRTAVLDFLLQNEKYGLIDNEGVRAEVNTFVYAGFDTTTLCLSFTVMAIVNEPDVQEKVYEEQQRILGDSQRTPTIEELNEMKYLECCIKESLRLYPSVPIISRKLLEDTVINGYTVPAGSTCVLSIFEVHRRADLFPDPKRFDPDRFLPENSRDRHPYSYIPFSAGLRNCIGQKFAMLEMKTVLSGLFRKFSVEPVTRPADIIFLPNIVLKTKQPLYARFRLRK